MLSESESCENNWALILRCVNSTVTVNMDGIYRYRCYGANLQFTSVVVLRDIMMICSELALNIPSGLTLPVMVSVTLYCKHTRVIDRFLPQSQFFL